MAGWNTVFHSIPHLDSSSIGPESYLSPKDLNQPDSHYCYGKNYVCGYATVTRSLGDLCCKANGFDYMLSNLSPAEQQAAKPFSGDVISAVPYIKYVLKREVDGSRQEDRPYNEFIILASDGFWDVISPHLAIKIIKRLANEYPLQVFLLWLLVTL